jgi:hypothetical protein
MKLRLFFLAILGIASLPFAVQKSWTCSVPVFRYALERWKPDAYKAILIHKGALSPADESLFRQLETTGAETQLNLRMRSVDTTAFSEKEIKDLLKGPLPSKLPALAIWHPNQMGKTAPVWTLAWSSTTVKELTDSPKRREMTESLIRGESSIVWIFVPSGNQEKDQKAMTLIGQQLDLATTALSKIAFYSQSGMNGKKLPLGFPITTISRTDPEERFFLDMLMHSESDLYEHKDEPMVFPVFGRGRALGCLFGKYITEKKIQQTISFLAGACSCEVKDLNPGKDLLLAAIWDRVVMGELYTDDDATIPELTGVMPGSPSPAKQSPTAPYKSEKKSSILLAYGITLGSVFVVVIGAGLILNRRRKRE